MKESKLLRNLDKYLGPFLCALCSLLNLLFWYRKSPTQKPVEKVLFVEFFEMAVSLMAYPSLEKVKRENPQAKVFILCSDITESIWKLLGFRDEQLFVIRTHEGIFHFLFSYFQQCLKLRFHRIDVAIDLELFMRISSLACFLISPRRLAGFSKGNFEGLYRGNFYDKKCIFNPTTHISENFLSLTKTAFETKQSNPSFKGNHLTQEMVFPQYSGLAQTKMTLEATLSAIKVETSIDKLILVCPDVGPNLSVRNYPKANFVSVIHKVLNEYSAAKILLVGVAENQPICTWIEKEVNDPRCLNFCGKTSSLEEFLELIAASELVLTNDNGTAHFAALTNTKAVALFSTDTPYMYGPLGRCLVVYEYYHCSPCISAFNHKQSTCDNNLCLQSMSIDKVFSFVKLALEGRNVPWQTIDGQRSYLPWQLLQDELEPEDKEIGYSKIIPRSDSSRPHIHGEN